MSATRFRHCSPDMVERTAAAIASLVKPGGTLLVFTRIRPDGAEADGPPWPLEESATRIFEKLGFALVDENRFENERRGPAGTGSFRTLSWNGKSCR